jgi:hypothetical protein
LLFRCLLQLGLLARELGRLCRMGGCIWNILHRLEPLDEKCNSRQKHPTVFVSILNKEHRAQITFWWTEGFEMFYVRCC